MKNKEIREYNNNLNLSDESSRVITGMAVVFESESEDLGFREIIHKGAITEQTIKDSDVFAKLNHNDNKILARSKYGEGTLKLTVDEVGVKYEFEAPNTTDGNDLLEQVRRGDLSSSSFAFTVAKEPNSERWSKDSEGIIHREIFKIDRLYDISPCYTPAYEATTCSARYEDIKQTSEEIDAQMELIKKEIENL